MKIHSIVACCNNGGIGYKNSLPWRLKKEMAHFVQTTKGDPPEGKKNAIIMGRKTWESIGRALPGRYNFVLSRNLKEKSEKMDGLFNSIEEFVKEMESSKWSSKVHEVICIGGAEIYKLFFASPFCGKIYLTRVLADYECDVFLPELTGFRMVDNSENVPRGEQSEDDGTKWIVEVYEKEE